MRIYVAGPYSGNQKDNVQRALRVATSLLEMGHEPYVPHLSHFWNDLYPQDYERWMKLCLSYVEVCNGLYRVPGESSGADREVAHAMSLGIPVYYDIDAVAAAATSTPAAAPKTFLQAVNHVTDMADAVMLDRQVKYGPDNIRLWGQVGIAVRLTDKIMRLRNLYLNGQGKDVTDETVEDTMIDIANYGRIALMLQKGIWGLPL